MRSKDAFHVALPKHGDLPHVPIVTSGIFGLHMLDRGIPALGDDVLDLPAQSCALHPGKVGEGTQLAVGVITDPRGVVLKVCHAVERLLSTGKKNRLARVRPAIPADSQNCSRRRKPPPRTPSERPSGFPGSRRFRRLCTPRAGSPPSTPRHTGRIWGPQS